MAAAYVDESSVQAFLSKVGVVYPLPRFGKQWSRVDLDALKDRLPASSDDLCELL